MNANTEIKVLLLTNRPDFLLNPHVRIDLCPLLGSHTNIDSSINALAPLFPCLGLISLSFGFVSMLGIPERRKKQTGRTVRRLVLLVVLFVGLMLLSGMQLTQRRLARLRFLY